MLAGQVDLVEDRQERLDDPGDGPLGLDGPVAVDAPLVVDVFGLEPLQVGEPLGRELRVGRLGLRRRYAGRVGGRLGRGAGAVEAWSADSGSTYSGVTSTSVSGPCRGSAVSGGGTLDSPPVLACTSSYAPRAAACWAALGPPSRAPWRPS